MILIFSILMLINAFIPLVGYLAENIGKKPTLNEGKHSVEVYIFDFSADVYDSEIKVEFLKRIRDEKQFDSLEDLQSQLKIDENNCKKYLRDI